MNTINTLDQIPENTIVISGKSLMELRHLLTPPNLPTYIREPLQPQHVWAVLSEEYPQDHEIILMRADGSERLKLSELNSEADLFKDIDYLYLPALPDQNALEYFQNIVAILRGPNGCPWDKKQTHQSLRDDFLQEVYELLDGLDRGNLEMISEELGDILLHVFLQAQIAVDSHEFCMGDVAAHVCNKIVYRHQHVFGNPEQGLNADEVLVRWEHIKQKEREKEHKKGGLLDGISHAMPALSMAFSYQKRAAKVGFDWDNADGVWEKLKEELDEFQNAETPAEKEEELGDILFCIVNLARWYKIDPETALREANLKFFDRVHYVEKRANELHKDLFEMPLSEKDQYWDEYKASQKAR